MEHEDMMIDIPVVLEALGVEFTERGTEANGLCPMHKHRTGKEDHSPSWWINLESGQHICFSCNYKGNIVQLVCDINEFYKENWGANYSYDYQAAEEWIASIVEMPIERLMEMVKKLPNYIESSPKPLEMSEARLAIFVEPPIDALDDRNITPEAARKYGVMWDKKKECWVLPLRDSATSKLMGWQEKGTIHRTFFNRPTGLQKSRTLFGIENQNESVVIVVESPLDCLRLHSAGIRGAVATCGSVVSEEQIKLLRASEQVIAAFDNPKVDKAGKKASDEMLEFARKYGLNLSFFNYGDTGKKDPGDLTDDEIVWGVNNAKTALLGEKAYV
jgi:hypothetical protein